jgi:hypothetical protein
MAYLRAACLGLDLAANYFLSAIANRRQSSDLNLNNNASVCTGVLLLLRWRCIAPIQVRKTIYRNSC